MIVPCTSEQETADAKALINPIQLQDYLPEDYSWAFIKDGDETVGILMWPIDTEMPTEYGLAPTILDSIHPNQNLYWGGE